MQIRVIRGSSIFSTIFRYEPESLICHFTRIIVGLNPLTTTISMLAKPTRLPELIIFLYRNKVRLQLAGNDEKGIQARDITYSIHGLFLADEISLILDAALQEHPVLFDDFSCVQVLVMDIPSLFVPRYIITQGRLSHVTDKYLRSRAGDDWTLDDTELNELNCYPFPKQTMEMLQEYYSPLPCIHLISLLRGKLEAGQIHFSDDTTTFYCLLQDHLIVLSAHEGKFGFAKQFILTDQADLHYYTLACHRMLRSSVNYPVYIESEKPVFTWPAGIQISWRDPLSLPSIPELISQLDPCVS